MGDMGKYVLKRLIAALPTIIGVSIVVFLLMHMVPGDPAEVMLGSKATPEAVAKLRNDLGLNRPLLQQYFSWMWGVLHGDLGYSISLFGSVTKEIIARLPATIELTIVSFIIAILVGVPAGIYCATKRGQAADRTVMAMSMAGVSMPVFWLGLLLISLFSVTFHLLPEAGRLTTGLEIEQVTGFYLIDAILAGDLYALGDVLRHMILPAIALSVGTMAFCARVTRSAVLEVIGQDYVNMALSKGLSERVVLVKHVLRNALIPVVTIVGLQLGNLMGGAILTETVFAWPGIGRLIINAINVRDYPLLQGTVLVTSTLYILVNILVDILYVAIDPRIKYE